MSERVSDMDLQHYITSYGKYPSNDADKQVTDLLRELQKLRLIEQAARAVGALHDSYEVDKWESAMDALRKALDLK